MKNLIGFAIFILLLVFVQFAQAQNVDDIIRRHVSALGGLDNLNKIQNMITVGSVNYQGTAIGLVITQVNNKLNRQDITANGLHGFDMLTEKDGWSFLPFQGMQKPEPKTAAEVKESQSDLDIAGPLVNYAAKGHKVELQGKEDVAGTPCYKIKASLASGKKIVFFIDPVSYMIVRTKEKRNVNGQETDLQTDYADYRLVESVKMPYSISQDFGTVVMSDIKMNQVIPESFFKHDM